MPPPARSTFRGIVDKIPYLKELGITTLELLPVVEFQEVMMPENVEGNPYGSSEPTGRLNYWGYTKAGMFAPKASYADPGMSPVTEFKYMVRELHRAGLEVVPELYFSGKEVPEFVLETVRFWVREYRACGSAGKRSISGRYQALGNFLGCAETVCRGEKTSG